METAMTALFVAATLVVGVTIAYGAYLRARPGLEGTEAFARLRRGALWVEGVGGLALLAAIGWAVLAMIAPSEAGAQEPASAAAAAVSVGEGVLKGLGYVGAGLATGCAAIGAGIGVGIAGAAGIGAISEKPGMLGKSLIYVGLAEGVAIYGLLISFMILNRI